MNSYEYRDNLGNPRDYYDIVNDATKLCEEIEEKDKEIEKLNNKLDCDLQWAKKYDALFEENNRLKNIIDELEKELKDWEKLDLDNLLVVIRNIDNKLKELKEGK